ncbi:MBL fold metallo-hydrolase [Corynebacterium ulceribovis]|uniref:MBL fold metallo-hydrolase n=1 Tax=Corynebacterium ulceribovis TaxID=487732 RepID=UPI00036115B7|nr:MBL fold metallo-hydrolase [Corynebacterium ulceribovis]
MELTVLGCSGSLCAPDNPASGYLLKRAGTPTLMLDFGPGVMGAVQRHADPATLDLVISHLHADHCLDIPGLLVWRRYHPTAPSTQRNLLFGPEDTATHVGDASADHSKNFDDLSDTFDVRHLSHGMKFTAGGFDIEAIEMVHPCEAYGFRVQDPDGSGVLAYTGDTAWTDNLIDLARDADVFMCEATWCGSNDANVPGMHLDGAEAGRAARLAGAKHLVLIHIPPYGDAEAAMAAARTEYDGPITLATPGMEFNI